MPTLSNGSSPRRQGAHFSSPVPEGTAVPFIPGVMELFHVSNTGAAFSVGSGNALSLCVSLSLSVCFSLGNLLPV